ncbi:MAG: DNA replication/repair protein RecF, partial [Bacillota bacterium]
SLGTNIIQARVKNIKALEEEAKKFFHQMTEGSESLELEYACDIDCCSDYKETKSQFLSLLSSKYDQELRRGSSLVGPHLDDLKIMINGHDTRKYSSQGQKRTAALALKMAEVNLFKRKHEKMPIILLDDVFSEFDQYRKQYFLDYLKENTGQCFITTAIGLNGIINKLERDYKIFTVWRGSIKNENSGPVN